MKKIVAFLWPVEAKLINDLGFVLRYKWWHPLSYVAITITIIQSLYVRGFKETFKNFDNPFKWQTY